MKNTNNFGLSGRVMRTLDVTGGRIITIGNNQDYRKDDEWVSQAFYFGVIFFDGPHGNRATSVSEGDFVHVTGRLNTRQDPNDEDGKRTVISLIGSEIDNFTSMVNGKKDSGSASKQANKAGKSEVKSGKSVKKTKDASDDDELDLFDN